MGKKPVTDGKMADYTREGTKQNKAAQFFFYKNTSNILEAQVAISSVSEENALQNLDKITSFDEAREKATQLWAKNLNKIQVETPTDSLKNIFYTALYHTQIAPVTFSDANGECRLQNDSIVKSKDFTVYSTLSLWDTFRAEQPLLTLLAPENDCRCGHCTAMKPIV